MKGKAPGIRQGEPQGSPFPFRARKGTGARTRKAPGLRTTRFGIKDLPAGGAKKAEERFR